MRYKIKEDGQSLGINLWPTPRRKMGGIGMQAKAGLRKIEQAVAENKTRKKKKTHAIWGKRTTGLAGHRGRQNFIWAAKTKTLLKRLGL